MAIRGRFGSQPGRVERMPRPASRIWFATNSGFIASWYDRVAMQRQTTVPYKTDFALWLTTQAAALREGRFGDLDAANIAEELDSLGNSDRREIRSRLKQVAAQLLKYQYQPERATSWRSTIVVQVSDIEDASKTHLRCGASCLRSSRRRIRERASWQATKRACRSRRFQSSRQRSSSAQLKRRCAAPTLRRKITGRGSRFSQTEALGAAVREPVGWTVFAQSASQSTGV